MRLPTHRLVSLGLVLALGCGPSAEDIAANLESDNPIVREDSALMARNYTDEVVLQALVKALEDPSVRVRENAVDSLATLGEDAKAAVPALIRVVQTDPSPAVVQEAVDALGRVGDPAAVPVLISWLEEHGADKPTLNAIWALGALEDDRALPLLARLRESEDAYVAWNAERALSQLKPSAEEVAPQEEEAAPGEEEAAPSEAVAPQEEAAPGGFPPPKRQLQDEEQVKDRDAGWQEEAVDR